MRRLTLEFSLEEISKIDGDAIPQNVDSLEVLHFLKQDQSEISVICRVIPKDPKRKIDLFQRETDEVRLLEKSRDGALTFFIKSRPRPGSMDYNLMKGGGGYLVRPSELRDGKTRITFLGNAKQVKTLLQKISASGASYKLVSLIDARFAPDSVLGRLTEKQRRVLVTAYDLGYYDLPKRSSSEAIAAKLRMKTSTFTIHRIKAERKLIAQAIKE